MAGSRKALLVATDSYSDRTFRRLRAPAADAEALSAVLCDITIGGYAVEMMRNALQPDVMRAIDRFFARGALGDLLFLYVSGHGVKDSAGKLYLPMTDSSRDLLSSTAVPAQFISDRMGDSRCHRIVVCLDCCYAGAFPAGLRPKADEHADVAGQFGGRGSVVMTASSALEYAYEPVGGALTVTAAAQSSVFTGVLTEGLRTGNADRDGDGQIDVDELYDYAFEKVHDKTPGQTPQKISDVGGKLIIASSIRGPQPEAMLPWALVQAIRSPLDQVRAAVIPDLSQIATSDDSARAAAARTALTDLAAESASLSADRARAAIASLTEPESPPAEAADETGAGDLAQRTAPRPPVADSGRPPEPDTQQSVTAATSDAPRVTDEPLRRILQSRILLGAAVGAVALAGTLTAILIPGSHPPRPAPTPASTHTANPPIATISSYSSSCAFNPVDGVLATSGYGGVKFWNLTNPARPKAVGYLDVNGNNDVPAVAFAPENNILATQDDSNYIRIWKVNNLRHATALSKPWMGNAAGKSGASSGFMAFSSDGHLLAVDQGVGTAQLWNIANPAQPAPLGQPIGTRTKPDVAPAMPVTFSHRRHILAVANTETSGTSAIISLYDETNPPQATPIGHVTVNNTNPAVDSIAFSPDDHMLAVSFDFDVGSNLEEHAVQLWNIKNPLSPTPVGNPITTTGDNSTGWHGAVAFRPDGRILAAVNATGAVQMWNVTNRAHPTAISETLPALTGGSFPYTESLTFSRDGNIVVAGQGNDNSSGVVRFWRGPKLSTSNPPVSPGTGSPRQ